MSNLTERLNASAINISQRLYVDSDGETYPITNLFDSDGEECGPEDAVAAVAGREGRWFSIMLADFEGSPAQ